MNLELGALNDIAWHPDGHEIAVATPEGIRFHDPMNLEKVDFWANDSPILSLLYLSDGTLISGDLKRNIKFWNEDGLNITLSNPYDVRSFVISPNEKFIGLCWYVIHHNVLLVMKTW